MKKCFYLSMVFYAFFISSMAQQINTMKIGNQIWMISNLNNEIGESWSYNDDPKLGSKYGRLYSWEAAKKTCPSGYRLPAVKDWDELLASMGGEDKASVLLLKPAQDGGFNAKLGGITTVGDYKLIDSYGAFWTSSENDKDNAWFIYFTSKNTAVTYSYSLKSQGFSVRCIKKSN